MVQEPQGRRGKWPQSKSEEKNQRVCKKTSENCPQPQLVHVRPSDNDCESLKLSVDVMGREKYNSSALYNSLFYTYLLANSVQDNDSDLSKLQTYQKPSNIVTVVV